MLGRPADRDGMGIARAFAASAMNLVLYRFAGRAVVDPSLARFAALYFPAGMSRPDDIARMVDWTTETFGSFDALIYGTGA